MTLKKTLFALTACALCIQAAAQNTNITARIKGMKKGDTAYIVKRTDDGGIDIDTAKCEKNGRFEYSSGIPYTMDPRFSTLRQAPPWKTSNAPSPSHCRYALTQATDCTSKALPTTSQALKYRAAFMTTAYTAVILPASGI